MLVYHNHNIQHWKVMILIFVVLIAATGMFEKPWVGS